MSGLAYGTSPPAVIAIGSRSMAAHELGVSGSWERQLTCCFGYWGLQDVPVHCPAITLQPYGSWVMAKALGRLSVD